MKLLGINSVYFHITDQLLLTYSALIRHWRKNGSTMGQCINYL